MAKLNSVMEQLKKDEYKVVLTVIQAARSTEYKQWKDCDLAITDAVNEAKDNVKYLASLEKYIEPLYTGTPSHIIDMLPGLLKNIRMMYSIARYYSTEGMSIINCLKTILILII